MSALWCRVIAAALIVVSAALHIGYLVRCPFDLAPDEAHYWHWSQQLDASYYSKGPLTALLIRASCELTGDWSVAMSGTKAAAVRLPAVVCGSLLLVAIYILTVQSFGRERLALLAVAAALTMPAFSLGRTLMTIDAPYACCWGWALVVGHHAIFRGSRWAWPVLGLIVGVGILAKYTMLLWIGSAGLFLIFSPAFRVQLKRPGFWIMVLLAAACCLPILWWNVRTGWVSLRHVGWQAGVTPEEGAPLIRWTGPFEYVGGQFGLLFGVWFVAWVAAMIVHWPGRDRNPQHQYLWFISVPQFVLFGLFSLRTDVKLNWPVTAYLSGLVLTAPWLVEQLNSPRPLIKRWYRGWIAVASVCGLFAIILLHQPAPARPVLERLAGPPTPTNALPIRRFDPTCRLRGWRYLSNAVDSLQAELRAEGIEPVLAASRWTTASELAFYGKGHPMVYSVGSALWDRQSQFDLWRPNPVHDPAEFVGRTFIFVDVGIVPPEIYQAFDKVEKTRKVTYVEDGIPISIWDVTVCRGFRGFASLPRPHY